MVTDKLQPYDKRGFSLANYRHRAGSHGRLQCFRSFVHGFFGIDFDDHDLFRRLIGRFRSLEIIPEFVWFNPLFLSLFGCV
jgi:hypothetical protein